MSLRRFEDVAVGDELPERVVTLTRGNLVNYAGVSGDPNPIHWSDHVARLAGLPDVVAHGMLTMGVASSVVVAALDPAARILDYGVRFTKPVVVDPQDGADVHVLATVGAVDDEAARIDLKVTFGETTVLVKAQLRVAI